MISVIVVDDHPIVRHGLTTLLGLQEDIVLVGEAGDAETALRLIAEQQPAVVLLDLRLPGMSGVELMQHARAQGISTRFLVLTTYATDAYLDPALEAGASGYLLKDALPEDLLRAIRSLASGGAAIEPRIAARLIERISRPASDSLSQREQAILQLLVDGLNNKAIAAQLMLSEHTVKYYMSGILAKLNVSTRSAAIKVAFQRGLIMLPDESE
jgi:DNA-binding NarL/FixJ family response regulator